MLSAQMSPEIRQYMIVTGNYWAFTLTDGALRMLIVLHFYSLGYTPLQIAALFLFYEIFGVVTNLIGGCATDADCTGWHADRGVCDGGTSLVRYRQRPE